VNFGGLSACALVSSCQRGSAEAISLSVRIRGVRRHSVILFGAENYRAHNRQNTEDAVFARVATGRWIAGQIGLIAFAALRAAKEI